MSLSSQGFFYKKKFLILLINSMPRNIAIIEIAIPKQPIIIPSIITKPSLESMPKEAISIPSPGM